jgi:hypothetical protein
MMRAANTFAARFYAATAAKPICHGDKIILRCDRQPR